jgi:uncharacterized protein involved in exopolysaccharide biosynthesis
MEVAAGSLWTYRRPNDDVFNGLSKQATCARQYWHLRSKGKKVTMLLASQQTDLQEITLRDLFRILKVRGLLIATVSFLFALGAGIAAFVSPKWYEASIVLSPVATSASSALGSSSSALGGLAALAGISVAGDSKKSESIAMLQSEALTERYIEKNGLLQVIYRDEWDSAKQAWDNPNKHPTLWKANLYFKKKLRTVSTDLKTGIITLTIKWKDPVLAADWANGLVIMTNEYLRNKAIDESERNIAYLTAEAAKTNIVEARQAIYTILQGEINKAMLARGSSEYAFKIIDPARIAEKQSSPLKSLWIIIGLFSGALLAIAATLIHSSWK